MNSSKKIVSGKQTKKDKKTASVSVSDKKRIFLGALCVVLVLVLCIGVGMQQLKPQVVLTVNKQKISLSKLMWPIYQKESMCLSYDQMYQQYYGMSIWDAPYQGTDANVSSQESMSTGLKQEVVDEEAEYIILSAEAKKAKMSLTKDEKKKAKEDAKDALYGLTFSQKLKLEISKRKLIKRNEMIALANKYKDKQKETTDKTVNEDEVKATVNKDDYKQYDIQYVYITNKKTDEESGEEKDLSKDEQKEREELLEKAYKDVTEKDKKISKVVKDDDSDKITYETDTFTEKEDWSFTSKKSILKKVKALKKGEVSEILEDKDTGNKFFVKMKDNSSDKSYDEACDNAVTEAKDKAYDDWYKTLQKKYPVKVNEKIWDDVEFGTVTTSIVTLADIEKIQKKKEKKEAKESASAEAASKAAAKKDDSDDSDKSKEDSSDTSEESSDDSSSDDSSEE